MAEAVVFNIFLSQEKTQITNVWRKIFMEATLLHIKAAACGRLMKSPLPSECRCMFDWYVLTTGEHLQIHVCSLCDLRCLSHMWHSFQIPQWNHSVNNSWGKQQCEQTLNWAISRIQTASFDHSWFNFLAKISSLLLAKAASASVLTPNNIPMNTFYH